MTDLVRVRTALISVSDKAGVTDFARALAERHGVRLISTGGTAAALRGVGLDVVDVVDLTGFPEMMAGRVKTLHPRVHGGILARLPEDRAMLDQHSIEQIDLVCVNLYPFERTIARPDVTREEAVEDIDIGGPCLIRAAAKNHARVAVIADPADYTRVLNELREHDGSLSGRTRGGLAAAAFARTAEYDQAIADHAAESWSDNNSGSRREELRYGENPHQRGWLVRERRRREASVAHATQQGGKQLGFINLLDADAALNVVKEFDEPACCIVKHATPCGVGTGTTSIEAFRRAYAGDPLAAFGGILALNQPVTESAAKAVSSIDKLLEVIVAPSFYADALTLLRQRWKNVRLLAVRPMFDTDSARDAFRGRRSDTKPASSITEHVITGGRLVQERDAIGDGFQNWRVVSERHPTREERDAMRFNWIVCRHVKSNAVVVGGRRGTHGIGGGQTDRVAAAEQAVRKAGVNAGGAVAASDAFFPFPDGPKALLDAGVTAIVQPGGSRNDQLTIDLVNERGATMIFTGRRHFRH